MNLDRLGLLGLIALIVAVMGVTNILMRTWAERNNGNAIAPAVARAY